MPVPTASEIWDHAWASTEPCPLPRDQVIACDDCSARMREVSDQTWYHARIPCATAWRTKALWIKSWLQVAKE